MAVTYLDLDLDGGLGDFDSTTITGNGSMGTETTYMVEGSGAVWGDVNPGAGFAYGDATLATAITNGDYFDARFYVRFGLDADFPTGPPAVITDRAGGYYLISTGGGGAVIVLRMLSTRDGGGKYQWQISTNSHSPPAMVTLEPGWNRNTWYQVHIYGFVDNAVGWLQVWYDGAMLGEITGIDLYPGATWDVMRACLHERSDATNTDVCFSVDHVLITDGRSPLPPGSGLGAKLRRGIISPFYNDQRTGRGDT